MTEFIGTFFLVLTIGCTVVSNPPGWIPPIAIGAVLIALVYAGRHLSGAHYNPAITVAIWIRGRCDAEEVLPYWVAQVAGAAAAAGITGYLVGPGTPMTIEGVPRALIAEFMFTFALAWVILNVATAKDTEGNSFYGLAIGATVMAGIFAVGDISCAAFNPAVAIALGMMDVVSYSQIWIHIVGTVGGAATAAVVFTTLNPDDK